MNNHSITSSRCPAHGVDSSKNVTREDLSAEAQPTESIHPDVGADRRIGVLLVNHGSHSARWRRMLLDVHAAVADALLAQPNIGAVRTAFMEYTEPSIATQLKAFDSDGFERVILVPLLLTVSSHSLDDIPTIIGARSEASSIASLQADGIERYTPDAEVVMTPLLDYPKLARQNVARRLRALQHARRTASASLIRDGAVLVGYGSEPFNTEWEAFFAELCDFATRELDLAAATYAWCGHIVRYRKEPTIRAIDEVLSIADRALVIPVLVAYDELFQNKIIGGALDRVGRPGYVLYSRDSILPEPAVNRWILEAVETTLSGI